ncbi:MAG: hypothetical protein LUH12_12375, partial [Bacteroides sp.]|nr:hypothetical protein [Bacteroides sp.]
YNLHMPLYILGTFTEYPFYTLTERGRGHYNLGDVSKIIEKEAVPYSLWRNRVLPPLYCNEKMN